LPDAQLELSRAAFVEPDSPNKGYFILSNMEVRLIVLKFIDVMQEHQASHPDAFVLQKEISPNFLLQQSDAHSHIRNMAAIACAWRKTEEFKKMS